MRRVVGVLAAALLVVTVAGSAVGAGASSTWHRSNYGENHERLICTVGSGVWNCRYDTVPNYPEGFKSNDTGEFNGFEAEPGSAWCPEWAADVCAHAQQFVVGATVYQSLGRDHPGGVAIWEELIFTDGDGVAPMYMYLVGPPITAVCPWYPTWDEALANSFDCFFPE